MSKLERSLENQKSIIATLKAVIIGILGFILLATILLVVKPESEEVQPIEVIDTTESTEPTPAELHEEKVQEAYNYDNGGDLIESTESDTAKYIEEKTQELNIMKEEDQEIEDYLKGRESRLETTKFDEGVTKFQNGELTLVLTMPSDKSVESKMTWYETQESLEPTQIQMATDILDTEEFVNTMTMCLLSGNTEYTILNDGNCYGVNVTPCTDGALVMVGQNL